MTEVPPNRGESDDADELYRRASALDAGRPSEPVRRAILTHAAQLAAARAAGKADKRRPAWWRPAAFGTLAAAGLAGLLVMPQFITHEVPDTSAPSPQSAATSAPAAPGATAPSSPTTAQNAPLEEVVVTEQRAAKAEQYAARERSRNAASKPAAQDELQEQASDDAQDKRGAANDHNEPNKLAEQRRASAASDYAAPARNQALSDAVTGSAAPRTAPAAALNGVPAAGAGAPTAQFGVVAGRTSEVMDPAAQLRRAAEMGDLPALRALLEKQPAIDARDADGRTALMWATLRGRTEAVEVLLSSGADPNAADARGTTPLQAALAVNQSAIAEALRRAGAR